jgi:sucrose phosphorylase
VSPDDWSARVTDHLGALYPDADLEALTDAVVAAVGALEPAAADTEMAVAERWSQADTILIAYGDSVVDGNSGPDGNRAPLAVLTELVRRLDGAFSVVHLLPFHPSSSDRGFAVVDFEEVDPQLGTWTDLDALGEAAGLMLDLVCNHVSTQSSWFRQFLDGETPGCDYFVTLDADADVSEVVRPRSLPLREVFETNDGPRGVWCTFGRDQADLDYANPEVLLEMLRVIDTYLSHRARFLRLDAVAYLWKQLGTPCIHLPQTHEVVRLWHTLLTRRAPGAALITETNVPDAENRSYFGVGDEAHLVYNFSLPPLVVDAVLHERADHLRTWLATAARPPQGCTFVNFLTSHDGIGLRPAEGLLPGVDIDDLVAITERRGGLWSTYDTSWGPKPYELDISLWDLLGGASSVDDGLVAQRFVCAHAIMAGLAGIPAVYINTLFAQGNDRAAAEASGVFRDISRARLQFHEVTDRFTSDDGPKGRATRALLHLLRTRGAHPAFHPDAPQRILTTSGPVLAFERTGANGQRIVAVHNCSAAPVALDLDVMEPGGSRGRPWRDLIEGTLVGLDETWTLTPYRSLWLTPSAD